MTATRYAYDTATTIRLVAHWCGGCGLPYGLPEGYLEARKEDHKSWTCPNGCVRHYPNGPSKAEREALRLREQLAAARSLAERESERRRTAEGERAAARGQVTRLRKRIGNGVCPCCNRTFADLGQHIAGEHPEFRIDEDEPNPTLSVSDLSPNQVWTLQVIAADLNRGEEGSTITYLHAATLNALVRRSAIAVEDRLAVPTATGLRLIAEAGSE